MRMRVTDEGLRIPKALLRELDEVEIRRQNDGVMIAPVRGADFNQEHSFPTIADDDPIYELGKYPVEDDATDAAVNLDHYISMESERG
ncbi:MAG: AbrB/MazE/SpoVT family DNA-binding domain-containing protein [Chloroflexota bacterium]|nr:AbrB/MazE/SpoVT family DNA-binding domain-containing protein [Chloroflexota bacterium]